MTEWYILQEFFAEFYVPGLAMAMIGFVAASMFVAIGIVIKPLFSPIERG